MKTKATNNKLKFDKNSVSELNADQLISVHGGSTIVGGENCSGCVCFPTLQTIIGRN